MNIDFKKGVLNGIIIYVVVFMVISIFIAFKISTDTLMAKVVADASVGIAAYLLATRVDLKDIGSAFGYGVVTVLVSIILDILITKRFNPNANLLSMDMLIGYALIVLAPAAITMQKK